MGAAVGSGNGAAVGAAVGADVGADVGAAVGADVGDTVGVLCASMLQETKPVIKINISNKIKNFLIIFTLPSINRECAFGCIYVIGSLRQNM